MVQLIATDAAFNRLKTAGCLPDIFWLNSSGVSGQERSVLQREGRLVGWFVPPFDVSDPHAVAQAVDTVQQHHAGSSVVVVAE